MARRSDAVGSQVKPAARASILQGTCGIDLMDISRPMNRNTTSKTDTWTWDTYLTSAQKLHKAGFPSACRWVKRATRSIGLPRCSIPSALSCGRQGQHQVNSDETRIALEYLKKLMA